MGKALPFPQHRHAPSTLDPAFKLRIGALSNDQGTEAPAAEDDGAGQTDATPNETDAAAGSLGPETAVAE